MKIKNVLSTLEKETNCKAYTGFQYFFVKLS
jgi:hypothetical protein